jgi:hypothetical protein
LNQQAKPDRRLALKTAGWTLYAMALILFLFCAFTDILTTERLRSTAPKFLWPGLAAIVIVPLTLAFLANAVYSLRRCRAWLMAKGILPDDSGSRIVALWQYMRIGSGLLVIGIAAIVLLSPGLYAAYFVANLFTSSIRERPKPAANVPAVGELIPIEDIIAIYPAPGNASAKSQPLRPSAKRASPSPQRNSSAATGRAQKVP